MRATARKLRTRPTWAEVRLWDALRRNALGVRFRRQHPIGPYIADFVCLPARLVVETDGETHFRPEGSESDRLRDEWMDDHGWMVLRFYDGDVHESLESVISDICSELRMRLPQRDLP